MKKIIYSVKEILLTSFLVIDLFCGAGGTTTGFAMSNGIAKVIACVNHDKNAIISHWENHPEVKHFEEDIRTLDLTELKALVSHYRILFPNAKVILWASLECTNFSKAKGGKSRDADSRTLADHLIRYINILNPDIVQIENVVEFMSWGPLDENGKPESKKNGTEWMRWRKEICAIGYQDEWRELNAADFGAYTSRNRLFGMFSKDLDVIFWPEPTHLKNPSKGTMFQQAEKWKPVKDVLDFEDEGNSVFGRKKDLSDKTLERIYAGLLKYVALGDKSFIQKYYSGRPSGKVTSTESPLGTITTVANQTLVQPCFLAKYYGNGHNIQSVNEPAGTIPTKDRFAKLQTVWLDKQFSGSENHQSVNQPAGSILVNDKHSLIQADFIFNKNSSTAPCVSLEKPSPTITQRGQVLVGAKFLTNHTFNNKGTSIEDPAPTLVASRRHFYLVNPQWGSKTAQSVEKPCFTLIARMDKAPPSLVVTQSGEAAIEVLSTDSEATIRIKEFMAAYGIVDIKMRMLKVPELLKIQGFPIKPIRKNLSGTAFVQMS